MLPHARVHLLVFPFLRVSRDFRSAFPACVSAPRRCTWSSAFAVVRKLRRLLRPSNCWLLPPSINLRSREVFWRKEGGREEYACRNHVSSEVTCEPSPRSTRRAALSRDALVNQPRGSRAPRALIKRRLRAGVVTHEEVSEQWNKAYIILW